jgi:agmatine deiminase
MMNEKTWRMPAEWEQHERTLMAWPTRAELWGSHIDEAKAEYAATANAIADFEPVTMVTNPGQVDEVRAACSAGVEVLALEIDDSWIRDSGPIFVVDDAGNRAGVDFVFNSWGERFRPFDKDASIARRVLESLGVERISSDMVLEGGAIVVDGQGTLLTTEQCLLNTNRNPSMTTDDIEAELAATLGIEKFVWLKWGNFEDAHTDGHIDGVAAYVGPGRILVQTCDDPSNPNYDLMAENMEILKSATDNAGRAFDIVEMPYLPYFDLDGETLVCCIPNYYVANNSVIVPVSGARDDDAALAIIARAYPGREVVGVPGSIISFGGGGPHCITQQVPFVS